MYPTVKPGTALDIHDSAKDIQRSRSTVVGEKKARVKSGIVNNKSMLYHKMNNNQIQKRESQGLIGSASPLKEQFPKARMMNFKSLN